MTRSVSRLATLGIRSVCWDGRAWDGAPVPDGPYVVTLFGRSQAMQDTSVSIPLFVDVTPPALQITGVSPAVYVPGLVGHPSVLSVSFSITSVSFPFQGRVPDEIQWEITKPNGQPIPEEDLEGRISFDPPLLDDDPPSVGVDGAYRFKWDADGQDDLGDGTHRIVLLAVDAAGYTRTDTVLARFDVHTPRVSFVNLGSGDEVRVVPDSLIGTAWDASGIDSLYVRYATGAAFHPVTGWTARNDTAFFAVVLADSITSEGDHRITVRAIDATGALCGGCAGRSGEASLDFTWDTTAPEAPQLDPFEGVWRQPHFPLAGDAPEGEGLGGVVYVYRGGVKADSVFLALSTRFETTVALEPGTNVLTATYADAARNESAPSNTVTVTLDDGTGFFTPTPFRPGDDFVINVGAPGRSAEIRVYDLWGDLVVILESNVAGSSYGIAWDGTNASGETVRKGPLVAVATVRFDDGRIRRFRTLFLLEASP